MVYGSFNRWHCRLPSAKASIPHRTFPARNRVNGNRRQNTFAWNVNNFADRNGKGGDFRAFPSYPASWETVKMGWLRRTFTVPDGWKGRRILPHFAAVAGDVQVRVTFRPVNSSGAGSNRLSAGSVSFRAPQTITVPLGWIVESMALRASAPGGSM
jgi:hypothetical protein